MKNIQVTSPHLYVCRDSNGANSKGTHPNDINQNQFEQHMLGNILIALTILCYGLLASLMLKGKPAGDYAVGYSFALLIGGAAFALVSGLLAWNMNLNHCFDWASPLFLRYRNWLVFLGWVSFFLAIMWSLEFGGQKIESDTPFLLRCLSWSRIYLLIPLLVLIPSFYLLNVARPEGFAPSWVKICMQAGMGISFAVALVIFGGFAGLWLKGSVNMFQAQRAWLAERNSDYKAQVEYIHNFQEPTIEGLLKYTHPRGDKQLRTLATAKIKSSATWEDELIAILSKKDLERVYVYEDNTRYVYGFLDLNKLDHPEKFIQPIQYSLKVLSNRIRKSVEDAYNLELGLTDVDAVCRVLDAQFKDKASEFRPAMLNLQQALERPAPERKNTEHRKAYEKELKLFRASVKEWLASNPG